MGRKGDGQEDNLIFFPGLVSRLVENGMTALKENKYYDALKYFQQTVELEPANEQARYGLVITNIELNRLDEALEHCESMLHEGIGSYFEILQVYVSLLVQLGKYSKVETLLEGVIQEEKLPHHLAESFYQLLHFSRQMGSAKTIDIEEDELESISSYKEWLNLLEKGELEQQWGAVQKLSTTFTPDMLEACRVFLQKKENDPVLKSYMLQMLKENDVKETVQVTKFGEMFEVNIGNLEDVFHEQFGSDVLDRLEDELGQESPSLYEIVKQVWWHFLFALYPKQPLFSSEGVWAAALHIIGKNLMDDWDEGDIDIEEICAKYKTNKDHVLKAMKEIQKIESHLLQIPKDYT